MAGLLKVAAYGMVLTIVINCQSDYTWFVLKYKERFMCGRLCCIKVNTEVRLY